MKEIIVWQDGHHIRPNDILWKENAFNFFAYVCIPEHLKRQEICIRKLDGCCHQLWWINCWVSKPFHYINEVGSDVGMHKKQQWLGGLALSVIKHAFTFYHRHRKLLYIWIGGLRRQFFIVPSAGKFLICDTKCS